MVLNEIQYYDMGCTDTKLRYLNNLGKNNWSIIIMFSCVHTLGIHYQLFHTL